MSSNEFMPRWDVALAALAKDVFQKKGAPLVLDDFRHLASEHAIRFDDIMESMFQLAIHGEWTYTDSSGSAQVLDQATLDGLYVKRRLSEKDLSAFDGSWQPVQGDGN